MKFPYIKKTAVSNSTKPPKISGTYLLVLPAKQLVYHFHYLREYKSALSHLQLPYLFTLQCYVGSGHGYLLPPTIPGNVLVLHT